MNVKVAWERLLARRRGSRGCTGFRVLFSLRALGVLEPADQETVEAHLGRCPACRNLAGELDRVAGAGRRWAGSRSDAEPTPALRGRWESVVRAAQGRERVPSRSPTPAGWVELRWVWAGVAACWVAVILLNGSARRSARPAAPRVAVSWTVVRLALGEGHAADFTGAKPVPDRSRPNPPRSDAAFPRRHHEG